MNFKSTLIKSFKILIHDKNNLMMVNSLKSQNELTFFKKGIYRLSRGTNGPVMFFLVGTFKSRFTSFMYCSNFGHYGTLGSGS